MTLEFDLTDALAFRERLGCPTLAAAHAGTALRERLETLTDDWEAARARRDLIDAQKLKATAGAKASIKRMREAIAGLHELIAQKEIEIGQTEAGFRDAYEAAEDACMAIEEQMHAERVKLRMIAALNDKEKANG
jgi:predicted  nucleic acid-binding Zn-ribbon protein